MSQIKFLSGITNMPKNPVITFPYDCDNWQKHSFNAIHNGDDVLINVPTSSGKTTSAMYAILYCTKVLGKRAIYTTPIKSLSNEKYNEFSEKFLEYGITVGIMTGDNKINPDADVIMVTAEILRNSLYFQNEDIKQDSEFTLGSEFEDLIASLSKETKHRLGGNIENFISTIGCVIMDEIHYMNDKERGRVWEETIIMLPKNIQLIMLSGTIGNREYFAKWISNCREKTVSIIYESKRIIPLKHYVYVGKKLYEYYNEQECYLSENYNNAKKIFEEIKKEREKKHKIYDEKADILSMVNYLKDNDMLQAIIFSFSRKDCEKYANMVSSASSFNFLDPEEKKQIDFWFNKYIGSQRDENGKYKYENIDSVRNIKELLDRGIAFHHSTMLQNLRELIEILMKKKLIKILFATETLCIGVNVPAKTCVFTGIIKPTGKGRRTINTSEYRQMAGRAGRRGLDTIGNVILLPLREIPYEEDIKTICSGFNPPIKSNFNFDYQSILKISQTSNIDPNLIFNKSLMNFENLDNCINLKKEMSELYTQIEKINVDISNYNISEQDLNKINTLLDYEIKKNTKSIIETKLTKKQEQEYKDLKTFVNSNYKFYFEFLKNKYDLEQKVNNIINKICCLENYNFELYYKYRKVLENLGYIKTSTTKYLQKEDVLLNGIICSQINDCDVLLLTEIIQNNLLLGLSCEEIVSLMSIFTDPIQKDKQCGLHEFDGNDKLHNLIDKIKILSDKISETEKQVLGCNSELLRENTICTDYMDMAYDWGLNKSVYHMTAYFSEYEIPEESFCKAMTKIGNIIQYITNIYKVLKINVEIIPILEMAQKYVVRDIVCTNSLYL